MTIQDEAVIERVEQLFTDRAIGDLRLLLDVKTVIHGEVDEEALIRSLLQTATANKSHLDSGDVANTIETQAQA